MLWPRRGALAEVRCSGQGAVLWAIVWPICLSEDRRLGRDGLVCRHGYVRSAAVPSGQSFTCGTGNRVWMLGLGAADSCLVTVDVKLFIYKIGFDGGI